MSLTPPTSRYILFDASLVIYIYIYIWKSKSSVVVACFLPGRAKDFSALL